MFSRAPATKKESPEERRRQMKAGASVIINESRKEVNKLQQWNDTVANAVYWRYGYIGGGAFLSMFAAFGVASRFPVVRPYASWMSLAGGLAGMGMHNVHLDYNTRQLAAVLDKQATHMKRMDEKVQSAITDYADEARHLLALREQIQPSKSAPSFFKSMTSLRQEQAEGEEGGATETEEPVATLDQQVELLVRAYEKRRGLRSA